MAETVTMLNQKNAKGETLYAVQEPVVEIERKDGSKIKKGGNVITVTKEQLLAEKTELETRIKKINALTNQMS